MSMILSIEPRSRRKGSYGLTLDDGRCLILHEEVIAKYRLQSGMEVDTEQLSRWIFEADTKLAYEMSLQYLGYTAKTCSELSEYLSRKGYIKPVIDATIDKLKNYSFLDDTAFAERWIRNKNAGKPVGRRWIAHELKGKGIAPGIMEGALESITDEHEENQAYMLGERYYNKYKELPHKELTAKIGQALLRRGFDWETARTVIGKLLSQK